MARIRELEHEIEKAVAMADETDGSLRAGRRASDKERIVKAIEETNGNRTHAAKLLGITRRALQMTLKELDLP